MAKAYIEGIKYRQFGHDVLFTEMRFQTLLALFDVDADVQRELDTQRRQDIRTFILQSLEQQQPFYFSPFVFSARGQIEEDENGFYLIPGSNLYISDGQHRMKAMESAYFTLKMTLEAIQYIHNADKVAEIERQIKFLKEYKVGMQIYIDLDQKKERQMFSDLNTERREAQPGQLLQYDHRDTYSVLTRQLAQQLQNEMEIEMTASRVLDSSSAMTTLVTMKRCLLALFEGNISQKIGEPNFKCRKEEVNEIAEAFFKQWFTIFPKNPHNRTAYASGLSGIQIALALAVHSFVKQYKMPYREAIDLLRHLKTCSWHHQDPLFQHLYKAEKKRLIGHSTSYAIHITAKKFVRVIELEMAVTQ